MDITITGIFGWFLVALFVIDCSLGMMKINLMRQQAWERRGTSTKLAMSALRQSLQSDPAYAFSWYQNLASALYDGMQSGTHELKLDESEDAARNFMYKTFGVVIPVKD